MENTKSQDSHYARNLIEATLDPLITIDVDGKIMDVNEAMVKATDKVREKLIGTRFSTYFTEERIRLQQCHHCVVMSVAIDAANTGNRQLLTSESVATRLTP